MAQHKVGDKYLDDDEYVFHVWSVWSFWLFVIGAVIVGTIVFNHVPTDWSKELRFGAIIGAASIAGYTLSSFAMLIRFLCFGGIGLGILYSILYWIWMVV